MKEELTIKEMEQGNFLALQKGREIYEKHHPTIAKICKIKMQEVCEEKLEQAKAKMEHARESGIYVAFVAASSMAREWETEIERLGV